jgi:hypothetical protein
MFESTLIKSFGVSTITGGLTEILKLSLLYSNVSTENTLLISLIFSFIISYIAQRYVFNGGRFFGISLLKYCASGLFIIQISYILLNILQNNQTVKNYIEDTTITDTRRKIYKYILINICMLITFLCIIYPLRKYFIFIKNKSVDYTYSYILFIISIVMFFCIDIKT